MPRYWNSKQLHIISHILCMHPQKLVEQVEKNYFCRMNGDIYMGMAGW